MIVYVKVSPAEFLRKRALFLRQLGLLLNVLVEIKRDANNSFMVYPWEPAVQERTKRFADAALEGLLQRFRRALAPSTETNG